MSKEDCDALANVLIIGDYGVGKTCMMHRLVDGPFLERTASTLGGNDFKVIKVTAGDKRVRVHIWDTAGQERYNALSDKFFRGANGIIIVYDITDPATYENLGMWLEAVDEHCRPKIPVLIVGNKSDLEELRQVPTECARTYCKVKKIPFHEVSVKDGSLVHVLEDLVTNIICWGPKSTYSQTTTLVELSDLDVREAFCTCC